ncbi:MAG TPA: M14 family zinc carboxypeptidase, partial [Longimicrobiales bacterium]|nr:M14 family zinc carboxypeptidase [Longimicrobiales bacterium]
MIGLRHRAGTAARIRPRSIAGALGVTLSVLLAAAAPASAQVPAPAQHFGFTPGEHRQLADWSQLTAYYEALAAASPRVRVDTIGRTGLGAPFVMVTVTSPQNMARLGEIRDVQLRLADPRRIGGEAELERLKERARSVVLITHGIHATEVGSSQSAANLLHRLASADDERTRAILDNVVLLDIP